jgi:hypothetical protein
MVVARACEIFVAIHYITIPAETMTILDVCIETTRRDVPD